MLEKHFAPRIAKETANNLLKTLNDLIFFLEALPEEIP